jgi:hypothetical protein
MDLKNPPALPGDTVGLTQPSKRLMWVLGSTTFEDHFVVAEAALNSVKMRVGDELKVVDLQLLLNILPSCGTTKILRDKKQWTP